MLKAIQRFLRAIGAKAAPKAEPLQPEQSFSRPLQDGPVQENSPTPEARSGLEAAYSRVRPPDEPPFPGLIIPAYDNSPDWPTPDWEARRNAVLERFGYGCQATGCIRTGYHLHAHHLVARWQGGNHELVNLPCLCPVHHALVHLDTNKVTVSQANCSIVSRHSRRVPFSGRRVEVSAHVRRHILVTVSELRQIREQFGLRCQCGCENWEGYLRAEQELIWTWCPMCNSRWEFEQGLVEETGTQLATAFRPTRNIRTFEFDRRLIEGVAPPMLYEGCPTCLNLGMRGYLEKRRGMFGVFIGCSEYPKCNYTRKVNRRC